MSFWVAGARTEVLAPAGKMVFGVEDFMKLHDVFMYFAGFC